MNTTAKLLIAGIVAVLPSFGTIGGSYSIGYLLNNADVIVAATVSGDASNGNPAIVNLAVSRTLKGSISEGNSIQFSWANTAPASGVNPGIRVSLLRGKTGVWFLKQGDSGFTLLPLVGGGSDENDLFLPIPVGPLPVADQYVGELDTAKKLGAEINAAAHDPLTADRVFAMLDSGLLDSLGPDLLKPLFDVAAASSNISARSVGMAGEIRNGMPSAVIALTAIPEITIPSQAQMKLASSLCDYRNVDSAGVAALASLTTPRYPANVRSCAAHALREIHTSTTLPTLVSLLTDTSSQIRYDAVIGIAQYAMQFPVTKWSEKHAVMANFRPGPDVTNEMRANYPATDLFAKNEQQYISFWKAWLGSHLVSQSGSASQSSQTAPRP